MANIVKYTDKQYENRLNDNLEELVQGKKADEWPTAFL
ncbi:zeta toxin family protein, partial [Enterococcus faecalis]